MVGDDIDWNVGTLEIVSPDTESFENGEKFLIMSIVVEFRIMESLGEECDRMNFAIG